MKDGFIKVCAVSPEIRTGDCGFNTTSIIQQIKNASEKGVRLAAFPELCVTGATCGELFSEPTLLEGAKKSLEEIREKTRELDIVSVVGAPLEKNGRVYNAAFVIYHGELLGTVTKKELSSEAEKDELRYFSVDTEEKPVVFRCNGKQSFSFGVEFGDSLFSPQSDSACLCLSGAEIIVCPLAQSEAVTLSSRRKMLALSKSSQLCCTYILACAGKGESTANGVYSGHCLICENGRAIAEAEPFSFVPCVTETDVDGLSGLRLRSTAFRSYKGAIAEIRGFDMEIEDTTLTRAISASPFIPSEKSERESRCREILSMQAHGLAKRLEHTRSKTAVIGISGGLDSCLALLVCVKAMEITGRSVSDILAITMPCFGTTKRTRTNAEILCERLGVSFREIDIAKSVSQHFEDIAHDAENKNVVFENAQARERTQILMDIANETGGIVVGTGDLSEIALGWSTYNGDHISMYGVNSGIPKTLVRHVVRTCADDSSDDELKKVLYDILDTPVSPELLPAKDGEISQKTEELVGPYELHDFFLYYAVRLRCKPEKVKRLALYAFGGRYDEATVEKWLRSFYRRFFTQQFKRSCSPDGVKIGSVNLSATDFRMPSDACFGLWLDDIK